MPFSSLNHTRPNGDSLFSVPSLRNLSNLSEAKLTALASISINTLSQLLNYQPYHAARILLRFAAGEIGHDYDIDGHLKAAFSGSSATDIPDLPLQALIGVSPSTAGVWDRDLGVSTIRELVDFPAFTEASRFLRNDAELFNEPASAPDYLIPRLSGGIHSSVRFNSFILVDEVKLGGRFVPGPGAQIETLPIEIVTMFVQEQTVFGIGFVAGFKQEWINDGTHLGEIVHSLALAPGESRNISVLEWYRRQVSGREEETNTLETLTNELVHTRALNEVTRVTAQEHLEGRTDISSRTSTSGYGRTAGFGGGLGAAVSMPLQPAGQAAANLGLSGSTGSSRVRSNSSQQGTIKTSSKGTRSIVGSVVQDITDTTVQNSSNARSLYSTVIVSDIQQESEQVNTRNVTNYNHSHALTIQYFEVLQKYLVSTRMDDFRFLIYVPFKPVKFSTDVVLRYWQQLGSVLAMKDPVRYERYNSVLKGGILAGNFTLGNGAIDVPQVTIVTSFNSSASYLVGRGPRSTAYNLDNYLRVYWKKNGVVFQSLSPDGIPRQLSSLGSLRQLDELGFSLTAQLPPPANPTQQLNLTIMLSYQLMDSDGNILTITRDYATSATYRQLYEAKVADKVVMSTEKSGADVLELVRQQLGTPPQEIIPEILSYFNLRRYRYSRAILDGIEPEALTDLFRLMVVGPDSRNQAFSNYALPIPVGVSDNYLIFEARDYRSRYFIQGDPIYDGLENMADEEISPALREHAKTEIFLPTAGVFAEAVLGRSNASEFVDPRRFWNWQDSPIPNTAPEIAPVVLQSRAQDPAGDLNPNVPGNNLNIINPAPFQYPTGLSNGLAAIQNGSMFRDMSASAQLVQALGKLTDLANSTAQLAGQLSGEAGENALKAAVEMGQQAATLLNEQAKSVNRPKTPTERAAALNELDKIPTESGISPATLETSKAKLVGADVQAKPVIETRLAPKSDKPESAAQTTKDLLDRGAKKVTVTKGDTKIDVERSEPETPEIPLRSRWASPAATLTTGQVVTKVAYSSGDMIAALDKSIVYQEFQISVDAQNSALSLQENFRVWLNESAKRLKLALNGGDIGVMDLLNISAFIDNRKDTIATTFSGNVLLPGRSGLEITSSEVSLRVEVLHNSRLNLKQELKRSIEADVNIQNSTTATTSHEVDVSVPALKKFLKLKYGYRTEDVDKLVKKISINKVRGTLHKVSYILPAQLLLEQRFYFNATNPRTGLDYFVAPPVILKSVDLEVAFPEYIETN